VVCCNVGKDSGVVEFVKRRCICQLADKDLKSIMTQAKTYRHPHPYSNKININHHHQKHPKTKQYKLIHSVSSWYQKKLKPVRTDLPRFMTASTMGSVNPPCLTTYDLEGRGSSDIP
jgi:hypothetical protein